MATSNSEYRGELGPVGKNIEEQQRNASLLAGYDYSKYPSGITGFAGQDLQRIACVRYQEAIRTRVGPPGNYKAGLTRLADGKLLIAVCRLEPDAGDPVRQVFRIYVYESCDEGLTWREIAKPDMIAKEPSLTALSDGSILMTAKYNHPEADEADETLCGMYCARSEDAGVTWHVSQLPIVHYVRNVLVEKNGSLLFLRPTLDWKLQLGRSRDHGQTWEFSEGRIASWSENNRDDYGEICVIRLDDGALLAGVRSQLRETEGHEFESSWIMRSDDDGKNFDKPVCVTDIGEVQPYLTKLSDGRILLTYTNYHLPYGVCAMLSSDGGKTWDHENCIQLAVSADLYNGWPVTLELPDGELITSYATTTYLRQPPETTTCEVVRWRLPE